LIRHVPGVRSIATDNMGKAGRAFTDEIHGRALRCHKVATNSSDSETIKVVYVVYM